MLNKLLRSNSSFSQVSFSFSMVAEKKKIIAAEMPWRVIVSAGEKWWDINQKVSNV